MSKHAPAPDPFADIEPIVPAETPVEPPVEPSAAAPEKARTWAQPLRRLRLSTKLPAIIVSLLALGLGLFGIGANLALSAYMVQQVDESLQGQILRMSNQGVSGNFNGRGPTDYAQGITTDVTSDELPAWRLPFSMTEASEPNVTSVQTAAHAPGPTDRLEGYTVASVDGSTQWRAMSVGAQLYGEDVIVTIALPLKGVDTTLSKMRMLMIWGAIPILVFGSLIGYWLVRRSLRPLKQVEATASAIAAGDLTQRVPEAPPGTEVGELTESLNGMLTQIERAFDAKDASEARMRQFVSDASHELRTPLASVRGYGELYRMGALTDKKKRDEAMRRIEQEAARMGSLVQDLLQLARLDEGRQLKREPVDLTHVVLDAAADAHAADPSRPIAVLGADGEALSADDAITVTGDEDRIRQIVTNLLTNASKHTPPSSPVELIVTREDGAAMVQIRDHGEGIAPDQAARIFERFYRLDSSRARASGGSGLGLAIVASLVEAHGGNVDVVPTEGGGATFRVTLPV